jgi:hypothetical protein
VAQGAGVRGPLDEGLDRGTQILVIAAGVEQLERPNGLGVPGQGANSAIDRGALAVGDHALKLPIRNALELRNHAS